MLHKTEVQRIVYIIVAIVSVALIIAGIALIVIPGNHAGYNGGLSRASTSIEFGADYYTTAAQYIGLAANAATDIYGLIKLCFGLLFAFSGIVTGVISVGKLMCMFIEIREDALLEMKLEELRIEHSKAAEEETIISE